MIAWYWLLIVGFGMFVFGYAVGADAATPTLRPLEKGEKVLVPMDDGDAIALDEAIRWTFGNRREQARLEALQRRYRDARYNQTVESLV